MAKKSDKRKKQRHSGKRQTPYPHEHIAMVGYPGRYDPDNDNDNDAPGSGQDTDADAA